MAHNFLADEALTSFFQELTKIGTIHGPTRNEQGVQVFRKLASLADLDLAYQRTLIPPKKYVLPPKITTLEYDASLSYRQRVPSCERTVLFGLHACDLAAIGYLDRVFLADQPDPNYQVKRESLVLVGVSCEADEFCFCGDVGISRQSVPHDLFLSRTTGGYWVLHGSPLGMELITGSLSLTAAVEEAVASETTAKIATRINTAVDRHETFEGSPLWDDFANRCLSCGACSLCCPTCYCFDIREYGNLNGQSGYRIQEWDNCLFKSHGEVAGGINFRRTRQERFRYRFMHKYLGFGPLKGTISCVGCGRCREVCPVGIDLLELFREDATTEYLE